MRTIWWVYWSFVSVFAVLEAPLFVCSLNEQGSVMPICSILFAGCGIAGVILFLLIALAILIFVPKKKDS